VSVNNESGAFSQTTWSLVSKLKLTNWSSLLQETTAIARNSSKNGNLNFIIKK
jgi:hypothetical protein